MLHETMTVPFDKQPRDHSGDPVTPLNSNGAHYRFALVGWRDRPETIYATSPEVLLSIIMSDPELGRDPEAAPEGHRGHLDQAEARIRHAYGVAVHHAAQTLIDGTLPEDKTDLLYRSLDYTNPLTIKELPEWNEEVPLALLAPYYRRANLTAPLGNIVWLDSYTPELYLRGLARLGFIELREHTTSQSTTTQVEFNEPTQEQILSTLIQQFRMAEIALSGPDHQPHHVQMLVDAAQRTLAEIPAAATHPQLRSRLDSIISRASLTSANAGYLAQELTKIAEQVDGS